MTLSAKTSALLQVYVAASACSRHRLRRGSSCRSEAEQEDRALTAVSPVCRTASDGVRGAPTRIRLASRRYSGVPPS